MRWHQVFNCKSSKPVPINSTVQQPSHPDPSQLAALRVAGNELHHEAINGPHRAGHDPHTILPNFLNDYWHHNGVERRPLKVHVNLSDRGGLGNKRKLVLAGSSSQHGTR